MKTTTEAAVLKAFGIGLDSQDSSAAAPSAESAAKPAEANAEAKTEANAEAKTEANAEAKTEANAEAKTEANAEAKTEANAEEAHRQGHGSHRGANERRCVPDARDGGESEQQRADGQAGGHEPADHRGGRRRGEGPHDVQLVVLFLPGHVQQPAERKHLHELAVPILAGQLRGRGGGYERDRRRIAVGGHGSLHCRSRRGLSRGTRAARRSPPRDPSLSKLR